VPGLTATAPASDGPLGGARNRRAGALANTVVRRWQDHLPLNRLAVIYAHEALGLARCIVCGGRGGTHGPGSAADRREVGAAFAAPYVCTHATGVLVQAKGARTWTGSCPATRAISWPTTKRAGLM